MRVTIDIELEVPWYELREAAEAEQEAAATGGAVYSWKTQGGWNWLERRWSIVDVFGLLVLPRGLPEYIDMSDDLREEEDEPWYGYEWPWV